MRSDKSNQQNLAPLYSKQERNRLFIISLLLGLVGWIFHHYWLSPVLNQFANTAHCQTYLGFNGIAWLWYGLFVGLPLLIFVIFAGFGWPNGLKVLRDGQYPAKGKKVFRPTKIQYGTKAKFIGWLQLLAPLVCLALAVWGGGQAQELTAMPVKASAYDLCQPHE